MTGDHTKADLTDFGNVDDAGDRGALLAWLDAAWAMPAIRAAKLVLLDQLNLETARAVLDVGCGFGADVAEMAARLPAHGVAAGIDVSEAMIAEARRRSRDLGLNVSFDTGDAGKLPYDDASFDACRTERVLNHVPDPGQVIREMARVTRPGGRVGALEFDHGTTMVDHPDLALTRMILQTFADAMAQGWIGRQLPRLFRQAGLTDLQVSPTVALLSYETIQGLIGQHVERLCRDDVLTQDQAGQWWSELGRRSADGDFVAGSIQVLVTATRPG